MKTIKHLTIFLSLAGIVLLFFIGGCKKELPSDSTNTKNNAESIMSTKGVIAGKDFVLRQSPGLKFTVKSKTIERIYPALQGVDKITAAWKNEQNKKKNIKTGATVSGVNFTATLNGTYYNCYGEMEYPGSYDWYLLNWNTGVYTYIGSTADQYINFNVNKPSMYGSYRLWAEGPNGAGFTGYQYLGDPYVGVTMSSGMLSFTSASDFNALKARLDQAYEDHQAAFFDPYDYLSDDDMDALAISSGFREFLPLEEFEAYFGLSSLRAKIQGEVEYWLTQDHTDMSDYPADAYFLYDLSQQTLLNSQGEVTIGGIGEGPIVFPTISGWKDPANPGPNSCVFQAQKKGEDTYGTNRTIKKKVLIEKWPDATYFIGNTQTFKKFIYKYVPAVARQKIKVYGNYYNGNCVFQSTFDSGFKNPELKRRFSQRVNYKLSTPNQSSKSGEFSTDIVIGSTTYSLAYTH